MKKIYKFLGVALIGAILATSTSCRDDFADLNKDPNKVVDGQPPFLFTEVVMAFEPQDYTYWYYNADNFFTWMQTGSSTGGVTDMMLTANRAQTRSIPVLKARAQLKYEVERLPQAEQERYQKYLAAADLLCIYMGIFDVDFQGYTPYTEGGQAYIGGPKNPKYDSVEDLYALWLKNLDEDIKVLTAVVEGDEIKPNQDPVFAGKTEQWAKLANSLKLKIAARLVNKDRNRAKKIVEDASKLAVGFIETNADDFIFNKTTSAPNNDDITYHWNNDVLQGLSGSTNFINFLVDNKDPRVRFIYSKNEWNSRVVQAFLDSREDPTKLPHYIVDNAVITSEQKDGKTVYKFQSWKGDGEPWVRYQGIPIEYDKVSDPAYKDWYNRDTWMYEAKQAFLPYSTYAEKMLRGRKQFKLPVAPGGPVIQDIEPTPWTGMYMSAGEVNLYLAEFATLGASLPKSAATYFEAGVAASVNSYNNVAAKNKIPYYNTTYNYDPFEASIELKDGEIDALKTQESYKLTGDKALDLEKIYFQQIIHFSLQPIDMFTTGLRSGLPKTGSTIFPRTVYNSAVLNVDQYPRRFPLSQPSPSDTMKDILMQAYQEQGFDIGFSGGILNSQRFWQDTENPQWGEGPKL